MSHSGVKFIIDTIGKVIQEKYQINKERDNILQKRQNAEPVVLNPLLKEQASREGT